MEDASSKPRVKGTEVFVGNLPNNCTRDDLEQLFQQFGAIDNIRLMFDKASHHFKRYAFLRFTDPLSARAAQGKAQSQGGIHLKDRRLNVNLSDDNDTLFVGSLPKEWEPEMVEKALLEFLPGSMDVEVGPAPEQSLALALEQRQQHNAKRGRGGGDSGHYRNGGYAMVQFSSHGAAVKALRSHEEDPDLRLGGRWRVVLEWAEQRGVTYQEEQAQVKTAYVTDLPSDIDEEVLRRHFSPFGRVEAVKFLRSTQGGSKAFVRFTNRKSLEEAIAALDGREVEGTRLEPRMRLRVAVARPSEAQRKRAQEKRSKPHSGPSDRDPLEPRRQRVRMTEPLRDELEPASYDTTAGEAQGHLLHLDQHQSMAPMVFVAGQGALGPGAGLPEGATWQSRGSNWEYEGEHGAFTGPPLWVRNSAQDEDRSGGPNPGPAKHVHVLGNAGGTPVHAPQPVPGPVPVLVPRPALRLTPGQLPASAALGPLGPSFMAVTAADRTPIPLSGPRPAHPAAPSMAAPQLSFDYSLHPGAAPSPASACSQNLNPYLLGPAGANTEPVGPSHELSVSLRPSPGALLSSRESPRVQQAAAPLLAKGEGTALGSKANVGVRRGVAKGGQTVRFDPFTGRPFKFDPFTGVPLALEEEGAGQDREEVEGEGVGVAEAGSGAGSGGRNSSLVFSKQEFVLHQYQRPTQAQVESTVAYGSLASTYAPSAVSSHRPPVESLQYPHTSASQLWPSLNPKPSVPPSTMVFTSPSSQGHYPLPSPHPHQLLSHLGSAIPSGFPVGQAPPLMASSASHPPPRAGVPSPVVLVRAPMGRAQGDYAAAYPFATQGQQQQPAPAFEQYRF